MDPCLKTILGTWNSGNNKPVNPFCNIVKHKTDDRSRQKTKNKLRNDIHLHALRKQQWKSVENVETLNISTQILQKRIVNADFHGNAYNDCH